MELGDDDSKEDIDSDEGDPKQLLENLIQGMRTVRERQPQLYQEIEGMATYPAAFHWAISNRLNNGVEVLPVEADRAIIQYGIKCIQELLCDEVKWCVMGEGRKRAHEQDESEDESKSPTRVAAFMEREPPPGVGYDSNERSPIRKSMKWSSEEKLW